MSSGNSMGGIAGSGSEPFPHFAGGGFIHSSVPGRTDRIPMSVASDSYVLPADIISGLGQGSSLAGAAIMNKILSSGPYGTAAAQHRSGGLGAPHVSPPPAFKESDSLTLPREDGLANGGSTGKVPVIVAGAEFVVSPEQVRMLGGGDIRKGHRILDRLVANVRAHTIKQLKSMPRPKK